MLYFQSESGLWIVFIFVVQILSAILVQIVDLGSEDRQTEKVLVLNLCGGWLYTLKTQIKLCPAHTPCPPCPKVHI